MRNSLAFIFGLLLVGIFLTAGCASLGIDEAIIELKSAVNKDGLYYLNSN
ncbi:MAG: hypothetical protein GY780_11455 [bacterium]|nr:hypothetical protein [bacterium]